MTMLGFLLAAGNFLPILSNFSSGMGSLGAENTPLKEIPSMKCVTVHTETRCKSAKSTLSEQLVTALQEHFHKNMFITFVGSICILEPAYQVSATSVAYARRIVGRTWLSWSPSTCVWARNARVSENYTFCLAK